MPIRCADDLRDACTELSIEVLYSDPGEGRLTTKAKFDLDNLQEARFPCPQADCAKGGFYILDVVAPLVEAKQKDLQDGTTSDHSLSAEPDINCPGRRQRNGKDWQACSKLFKVRIQADVK